MKNLETWRRVARVQLIELIREIADASMATLKAWPATGEGRKLKEACEKANSVLRLSNLSNLAHGIREIEGVVLNLKSATETEYYRQYIAPRKLKSSRWKGEALGDVIESMLTNTSVFISNNKPEAVSANNLRRSDPAKINHDVDPISSIAPPQQNGPLQFEFREGILRVCHQRAGTGDMNPIGAEKARGRLVTDAMWLTENLANSNIDQRVILIMEEMRNNLVASQDIIETGIANIACSDLSTRLAGEISAPIAARWKAFTVGVSLYVSQFSEWHNFVDNSADFDSTAADANSVYLAGKKLASDFSKLPGIADPEVPHSIEILLEAMATPGKAGKRALFAVIRTIENVIAKIFSELGAFLNAGLEGSQEGVKKTAKYALLGAAASAAVLVSPSSQHIMKTDWMKKLGEVATEALEKCR